MNDLTYKTVKFYDMVKEFRMATGLTIDSNKQDEALHAKIILEELQETADGLGDSIVTLLGKQMDGEEFGYCQDKAKDVIIAAECIGFDIETIMDKIHNANMSKLCKDQTEADETKAKYDQLKVPSYQLSVSGNMIAIYSADNTTGLDGKFYPKGKLLKCVNWHEPDYSDPREWINDDRILSIVMPNNHG